jgi:protoheme IX farnesyltransferase
MVAFTVVHTVVGAILFATSIVAVLLCYRLVPPQTRDDFCHYARRGARSMSTARTTELSQSNKLGAYISLTKPDVSFLVLMTTGAGFYMGARGPIEWLHMLHVVFGTMMIAAGTAALNHYIERESDRYMRRTASRPLPTGQLTPAEALRFGVALCIAGAIDLYFVAGYLACLLGVVTSVSYLLAYTPLKKRTVWATFVGAIPGAIPPMIGWTAATGKLDAGAWLLFAILFFWQFPHFHAISWMYREDYARAGILMLPVVDKDGTRTFRQIVLYAAMLVAVSLLPAIMGFAGVLYFFGALVTCTALVQVCLWAAHAKTNSRAKWLMHATVMHIPILLGLMMYDKLPR